MSKSNHKRIRKNSGAKPLPAVQQGRIAAFLTRKSNILDQTPGAKPFPYYLLGFLIPFICGCLVMLVRMLDMEATPNNVFSILHSDAYYQYYPFLVDMRRSILAGESLQFSWNIGMGVDYIGLYAYYLGSPLNWLSILLPESWLLDYYTFMVILRISFAGLFFSIFLKNVFHRNDISVALFGAFYATCAWAVGYLWNVMWLDTFALLPLVILGMIRLLDSRKYILYTVALFFSVAINYYIGFFTCIFTLLAFICYQICRWKSFKKFLTDLGLMALFTLIAIGMTAFITLPTYASLQATHSAVNEWPEMSEMHITKDSSFKGFLEAFRQTATNTFAFFKPNDKDAATKGGLPNIYCGTFVAAFAFLFITCKQVKWRDKICAVLLLLFLNCSFIFKFLDYIWHGFHFTNEIPNRFSFVYSFVLLYMAYRAWLLRRSFKLWQLLAGLAFTFTCMFLSPGYALFLEDAEANNLAAALENFSLSAAGLRQFMDSFTITMLYPFLNGLLLILYFGFLLLGIRTKPAAGAKWKAKRIWHRNLRLRRSVSVLGLIAVIALELVVNTVNWGIHLNTVNLYGYPRGGEDTKTIIDYMHQREGEDCFYRAEVAQHQTYNDGMLNDYNGITIFSSSANVTTTNYLRALGLSGYKTYNRYAYEETSPLLHMFTNVKYVIERQNYVENNPYLTDVQSSGKVHLMENNYYLPVGFMVDPQLAEISVADENGTFEFQNRFLSAALGQDVTPWKQLSQNQVSITGNKQVELTSVNGFSSTYTTTSSSGRIFYNYTVEDEGLFCIRYYMPGKNKFTVSYKAAGATDFSTVHKDSHNGLSYISSICQVYPGDEIQVTVESGTKGNKLRLDAAVLDAQVMEQAYSQLSQSVMNVTGFKETRIDGTITCQRDGLMYTSVPQNNGNWHIYVDGEDAPLTMIGDAMIGVMLTEGQHTISIRYENSVLRLGIVVSCCSAVVFGLILFYTFYYLKKKKGKYSQSK